MILEYDVETTGFQPYAGHYPFMFQFWEGENDKRYYKWNPETRENELAIQAEFDSVGEGDYIRAWNSKFDFHFGETQGFTLPRPERWLDGMIVAHAVGGGDGKSVALKAVGERLFGADATDLQKKVKTWLTAERARRAKASKDEGTELVEPNYSDVPDEIMIPYGLEDVVLTKKIGDQYDPLVASSEGLTGIVDFEHQVMPALYEVEKRGMPASMEGYRRLEVEVVENLELLEDRAMELAQEGGVQDFNPRSSAQIIAALKGRGADMSYMETKDGEIRSADKENLQAVDDLLSDAVLAYRSEFQVLSTYVRPMIGRQYDTATRSWREPFICPDGRIHATYRQLGARTGRMSCADPNMQNQPRDDLRLRYNIVAPEGYSLVAVDLSGIEMALFAAYAGHGRLMTAIKNGDDLHTLTAEMLGIKDRVRAGGHVESARQRGKTFNFSIIYGGGVRTIKKSQRVNQADARLMKKRYFEAYPEVKNLQNHIEYRLQDRGYIQSLWGRRFRMDPRDAYKAVNYLVQGTAADLLKQALIDLHAQHVPVVGLVHDEIISLVPNHMAEEIRDLTIEAMCAQAQPGGKLWDDKAGEPVVPLAAEGDIVTHWSQAKDSEFVPVWAREAVAA